MIRGRRPWAGDTNWYAPLPGERWDNVGSTGWVLSGFTLTARGTRSAYEISNFYLARHASS